MTNLVVHNRYAFRRRLTPALPAVTLTVVLLSCSGTRSDKPAALPAASDSSPMRGKAMPDTARVEGTAQVVTLTAAQIQKGGVTWAAATVGPIAATAVVPGMVVANEDRTARLGAASRGRVVSVAVRPGDHVTRGQLLVTLLSAEAGVAQTDVAKSEAELTSRRAQSAYARGARERAERLLVLKAIPRQDYERAVAEDELARGAAAQAAAEVRRARSAAAQLGADGAVAGEVRLRSPLTGVVLARTAVPGAVIDAGSALVTVTDPTSLWLQVQAPEQLTPLFHVGAELRFTVPAYAGETFSAQIDAIGAGLEPDTRTLTVRAVVGNRAARLKPEMLASVTVVSNETVSAIVLPEESVQLLEGKPSVFVVRADGHGGAAFTAREVETGARSGGNIAVRKGLRAGELVATHGAFTVKAQLQKDATKEMVM